MKGFLRRDLFCFMGMQSGLAIKGDYQEAKPDTYRLFPLLQDNGQQQGHWKLPFPGDKDAIPLAKPEKPEEKLHLERI